jgi:glyoxylase-like metal-dependent hydrolase (beta-lactamase superfamily II)/DNA-binding beta-propeller fold protein YncE
MQFRVVRFGARMSAAILMIIAMLVAGNVPVAQAQDDVEEANKAVVARAMDEVYNQHNFDNIEELFAPNFVDHTPFEEFVSEDYDTLRTYLEMPFSDMPDLTVEVHDILADGDVTAVRFTMSSEEAGVEVEAAYILRLEDGLIAEGWDYTDVASLLSQLGVIDIPQEPEILSIASGFTSPQGVLVDPDGNVWVVDGGTGGETEVEWHNPDSGQVELGMMGETSRIVRIDADGEETVATLPSISIGTDFLGGARLALLDGELYVTSGQWLGELGEDRMPLSAVVAHVGMDGTVEPVGVVWDVEAEQNPGGFIEDSHPYGLAAGPDGRLWVADAGGNDLLAADPATGEVTLQAVFEGIPGPLPNPNRDGAMEMDPVPTGVAFGDDGTVYVSLLSGFPFVPGATKVVTVDADGNVSDYATGLTMLTDLRVGPDGQMYAVQFGLFTEQGPQPNSGAIIRVNEGDGSEVVLDGLSFPTSIDFNADGDAYITINGVGPPGSGELVMVSGLTDKEGMPIAEAMAAPQEAGPGIPEAAVGPAVPEDPGYLIEDMGDGLYVVHDGTYQAMFMTTGEGVIVVDAPPSLGQKLVDAIAATTDEPVTHVVYSHAHADHIGSAGLLPEDAVYIAHEDAAAALERNGANDPERTPPYGVFLGAGPVPLPTETFADSYTLEVGDQVLQLDYHGLNHSPGNIFIYAPKQKVLMLVDVIFPGWVPFKDLALAVDVPGFIEAHDQVLSYDFDTFVGGHLTRTGTREDVETQKAFVSDVVANAAQALQTVDFNAVAMETGMEHGFADLWVLFDAYLGTVADTCTELTLEQWGDKLGGAESFTESHCSKVMESLRID